MQRNDNYADHRDRLAQMSDEQLHEYFWHLVGQIIDPLIEEAKTHTSPAIERSVLLRMGFSSLEAKAIVNKMSEKRLLGHGAGKLVLRLALKRKITVRDAGLGLMKDEYWEEVTA
jgi:D-ornithine 4,5-aminomutase subunit alpha